MDSQGRHLLLIEDDPAVADGLRQGLIQEGFNVSWRRTGREGVTFAEQRGPHLVILDVRLPDGSGFDFCRQMRQMGLQQPILMLTARREELDKVLGLEMGADDYMTKPSGCASWWLASGRCSGEPTATWLAPPRPTLSLPETWSSNLTRPRSPGERQPLT